MIFFDILIFLINKTPLLIAIEKESLNIISLLLKDPNIDVNLEFI